VGGDSAPWRMDNFITYSSGHRHSSLDRDIKRSRHSDTCFLLRDRKGLWGGPVRPIIYTWRRYSQTRQQKNKRLAPVKKITLPRLEILAALVRARLLQYFCRETSLDIRDATLLTDVTVALCWIRSIPSRWKTFVCNRVTEIQTYTTPTH